MNLLLRFNLSSIIFKVNLQVLGKYFFVSSDFSVKAVKNQLMRG